MRTFTPPLIKANGLTTFRVQRCCNGCGHSVGDATLEEIYANVLPDVRDECPWCSPDNDQAEFEACLTGMQETADTLFAALDYLQGADRHAAVASLTWAGDVDIEAEVINEMPPAMFDAVFGEWPHDEDGAVAA